MKDFRRALLGQDIEGISKNIIDAAAKARRTIYDALWFHGTEAGLKIGFVKNTSFLNRIMDAPLVIRDQDGFVDKASEVYAIQFENELGKSGEVDIEKAIQMFDHLNSLAKDHGAPRKYKAKGNGANPQVQTVRKLNNDRDWETSE